MSMLEPEAAFEVGYRLHRLGLAGTAFEVTPGYLRTEEQLRRAMRVRLPPPATWQDLAEALSGEDAPIDDRAWYRRRFEAGEGREAETLSPLSDAVAFVVSPALRTMPFIAPGIVATGPGLPHTLAALGVAAHGIAELILGALPEALTPATRHFTLLMAAGSVLVKTLPDEQIEALLVDVTRVLIPPQHRENLIEKRILSLSNRNLLDQPPGEIERTIHGLQRRRPDRLHRAWMRGFFVPRGVVLPG